MNVNQSVVDIERRVDDLKVNTLGVYRGVTRLVVGHNVRGGLWSPPMGVSCDSNLKHEHVFRLLL